MSVLFGHWQIVIGDRLLSMEEERRYWFNSKTKQVEEGPKSLGLDRIGPFATRQEAQRAESIILEKAKKLREEDEED